MSHLPKRKISSNFPQTRARNYKDTSARANEWQVERNIVSCTFHAISSHNVDII